MRRPARDLLALACCEADPAADAVRLARLLAGLGLGHSELGWCDVSALGTRASVLSVEGTRLPSPIADPAALGGDARRQALFRSSLVPGIFDLTARPPSARAAAGLTRHPLAVGTQAILSECFVARAAAGPRAQAMEQAESERSSRIDVGGYAGVFAFVLRPLAAAGPGGGSVVVDWPAVRAGMIRDMDLDDVTAVRCMALFHPQDLGPGQGFRLFSDRLPGGRPLILDPDLPPRPAVEALIGALSAALIAETLEAAHG